MLTSPAPTQGPSPPPARPLEQSSSASYAPQTSPTPMNTSTSTQHRDKLLIGPGLERIPIIKKHSAKANEAQNSSAQRKPSQPIPFNPNGTAPHKRSRTSSSSESSSEEGGEKGQNHLPIITTAANVLQNTRRNEDVFTANEDEDGTLTPRGNPTSPIAPPVGAPVSNEDEDDEMRIEDEIAASQTVPRDDDEHPSQPQTTPPTHTTPSPAPQGNARSAITADNLTKVANRLKIKKEKDERDNDAEAGNRGFSAKPASGYRKRHGEDALWLFNNARNDIIDLWLEIEGHKLLIQPFSSNSSDQAEATTNANTIVDVVQKLFGAEEVCCTPAPAARRSRGVAPPNIYCMYAIDKSLHDALLEQEVVNTKEITFSVYEFDQPTPTFLGSLEGLNNIASPGAIYSAERMIKSVFETDKVWTFLYDLFNSGPDYEEKDINPVAHFEAKAIIESLRAERLDVCESGAKLAPVLNLYIDVTFEGEQEWHDLRQAAKKSEYVSHLHGTGKLNLVKWKCGLCHSIDHPSGMCPFPEIPGWITQDDAPPTQKKGKNRNRGGSRTLNQEYPNESHSHGSPSRNRGAHRGRGGRGGRRGRF